MRPSILKLSLLILAVAVAVSVQAADDPVTTTRDAQGIWFIEGGSFYDVYEAQGYAEATDRLWQMDLFRRLSRGKMSAILGPDVLEIDVAFRTIGYSDEELAGQFAALSADAQTMVQAYVDGVNRRINEFYAGAWLEMPAEYWMLSIQSVLLQGIGLPVLPATWEVNDVMAWMVTLTRFFDPEGDIIFGDNAQIDNLILYMTFGAVYGAEAPAMFGDLRWVNDPMALTYIPGATKAAATSEIQYPTLDGDSLAALRDAVANLRARNGRIGGMVEDLGAHVKMGSYAWTVSGDKTASGNATIYSGPQMGFDAPGYVVEGSIRGGGLEISGMSIPNTPGIIIGRTPHHAWSMQVGHPHTSDFWFEAPETVALHRMETIEVFGGEPVTIPIFRSSHGPIIQPMPYNPAEPPDTIISWAYGHWGRETKTIEAFLQLARAQSMDEFDVGMEMAGVGQHFTYADRDGNIAFWMSGWDPVRGPGYNPLLPSFTGLSPEWTGERRARAHDRNTAKGWYGGWNNKASLDYINAPNTYSKYYGQFNRAHVIDDYLSAHDDVTYEEIRDLALNIATTHSFDGGGNTWPFVADAFSAAVAANPSEDRDAAVAMIDPWDGHFVAGGPPNWPFGAYRADAWVFQDAWVREVLRLVFEDEFMMAGMDSNEQSKTILFNVLLRALAGHTFNDWFLDRSGSGKPKTAEGLIILALDNVIAERGLGPYNAPRGEIVYKHTIFGQQDFFGEIWRGPYSNRSTYAHCVEFDMNGPSRIESMFQLGQSGAFYYNGTLVPSPDPLMFSMVPVFDPFMPRPFPLFN